MIELDLRLQRAPFTLAVQGRVPAGGITAVFGPSGSGKTTLLRCIAGLEPAACGRLYVDGTAWQDDGERIFRPAHRRPVGFVFQDTRLFPHLTAAENLDYGRRRTGRTDPRRRAAISALLGLDGLLGRHPHQLSGGEQQRVAIARALVTEPRLLLMDEPLTSLDAPRKAEFLPYLDRLHVELEIPVLYVSHALDEVLRLADHLLLLTAGRVQASGPVLDLLTRLELPFARGENAAALVPATVLDHDTAYGLTRLGFSGGTLVLPRIDAAPADPVRVVIHARDVSLSLDRPRDTSVLNLIDAVVTALAPHGDGQVDVSLRAGEAVLLARITQLSRERLALRPGVAVCAQVKGVALAG